MTVKFWSPTAAGGVEIELGAIVTMPAGDAVIVIGPLSYALPGCTICEFVESSMRYPYVVTDWYAASERPA